MAPPPPQSSLAWTDGALVTLDQRMLPHEYRYLRLRSADEVIEAVSSLAVRGAPAIGLAGAFAVALSAQRHSVDGTVDEDAVLADAERIAAARPTAVNLAWAVRRATGRLGEGSAAVLAEALSMLDEDIAVNQRAVDRTVRLVRELCPDRPLRVLTHCNTGRLATAAVGTALGAILQLARQGGIEEVLVGETRPLLQGARLTAWELGESQVPYRICTDSAAPAAIARGMVDLVLVGADRIAANGDTANKTGTYSLAVAAARSGIPFVVVAPESSWDRTLSDGSGILIEERNPDEVTGHAGTRTAPPGARAYNPAFDVTPADLITAIVSEQHTVRPTPAGDAAAVGAAGELASLSAALYRSGWMPGTAGNLSMRLPGDHATALVTPSGRDKSTLVPADMVEVLATTGAPLRTVTTRPSAETAIHAAVYRHTDANAVIHVHSPYATAVATRHGHEALPVRLEGFELLKGLGLADPRTTQVPVFTNWADVSHIAEEIAQYLRTGPRTAPGLLIADHGITVWGKDLAQARNRLECFEAIFHQVLLTGAQLTTVP